MAVLPDDPSQNPFWPFTNIPVYYIDNENRGRFTQPDADDRLGQARSWGSLNNGRHIDWGSAVKLLFQAFGRAPTAWEVVGYVRGNNMDLITPQGKVITSVDQVPTYSVPTSIGQVQVPKPSHVQTDPRGKPSPSDPPVGSPQNELPDEPDDGLEDPIAVLENSFPWLKDIGIGVKFFDDLRREGINLLNAQLVLERIRRTDQWQERFEGIRDPNGTLRFPESEYLRRERQMLDVLRDYGDPDYIYEPGLLGSLFDNGLDDPDDLEQRLRTYRQIETGGRDLQDAFYVYAGMRVSVDELYEALVDPAAGERLINNYETRQLNSNLDYETFIQRATEAGLQRVADELTQLQQSGAATARAVAEVRSIDPQFAEQMLAAIAQGAGTETPLSLAELEQAFAYAMIGSTATGQGLELPGEERVQEIINAGKNRAAVNQAYADFSMNRNLYRAAVRRAGGGEFTQADFEEAALLEEGSEIARFQKAMGLERSKGLSGGGPVGARDPIGRLRLPGLRSY